MRSNDMFKITSMLFIIVIPKDDLTFLGSITFYRFCILINAIQSCQDKVAKGIRKLSRQSISMQTTRVSDTGGNFLRPSSAIINIINVMRIPKDGENRKTGREGEGCARLSHINSRNRDCATWTRTYYS